MTVKEFQHKIDQLQEQLNRYPEDAQIRVKVLDEDGSWMVPSFTEPYIEEGNGVIYLDIY